MSQILGCVERITYQNPENGYTVAQLQEPGKTHLTCIVGNMPSIQPGETIRCVGSWKQHLVHGNQFIVEESHIAVPADLNGIVKYLGSGLIKGIGPSYAKRIVEAFGLETLNVIDSSPEQLLSVAGLGKKRAESIKRCWAEQKVIRDLIIFLQSYNISPTFAHKIFKTYRDQSIVKIQQDPYCLAREIHGIGFKSADGIAKKLGMKPDAPMRIDSGIEYVLGELAGDGHVCYPLSDLMTETEKTLEVEASLIEARIAFLKTEDRIEVFNLIQGNVSTPFVWIKSLFLAETGIAREVNRLRLAPCNLRKVDIEKAIEWVQTKLNIQLATNQKLAVHKALETKIQIITGGPGTGKSTITKAILSISDKITTKILLAAPTGRAAKRMSEITGRTAKTIHSLLEVDFKTAGGFKRNRQNPLECDLIIIDEASMIDTVLMYHLLKAIPSQARVILIGDINQLPSVGPGNVLKDLIASAVIPTNGLNEIFRQAAGSRIITNAHRINQGQFPDINNHSDSDFFFIEAQETEDVLKQIVQLVSTRLPRKYNLNALTDIQVLAPMRKGIIGTDNLNLVLQEELNPNKQSIYRLGRKYSNGDKVMQIRNNYDKEVFNGDIGFITEISTIDQQMIVSIDDREVIYEFSEIDELMPAYAVSIHKYQGSECPCIIIPVHTTHFKLLFRNLLYTGVTRGKKLVVLVGTKKALFLAVKNDEVKNRHTGLKQALIEINNTPL